MPYKSVKDLPAQIKVLPNTAQQIFLRVFNRAIKKYTEEEAFKIAWSIVKNFYQKNKAGKWEKVK